MAERGSKKTLTGVVVSDAMEKTVVVANVRMVMHPVYGKRVKRTKRLMAHDEKNLCKNGDKVKVMECRPMSAKKRWRVVEVLK